MIKDFAYRLGRVPSKPDRRTLRLGNYLSASSKPPAAVDWGKNVRRWGLLGNAKVSDCTWAAGGHAEMLWTASAHGRPARISTQQCLKAYEAVTKYDPRKVRPNGTNPTDAGTTMLDALRYWRKTGIAGRRIEAFTAVDGRNIDHVKLAINRLGCVYVGFWLPNAVLPKKGQRLEPWTVTPDGSRRNQKTKRNGHCVIYTGYDASGPTVISWGAEIPASWGFHRAYSDEVYAMLSPDFLKHRKNPRGISIAGLRKDLEVLEKNP